MKNRKFIPLLLSFLLVLSTITVQGATFKDVPVDSTYFKAVSHLSEKGILNGYENGTFKPEGYITRAETAAIAVRASGLKTSTSMNSIYADVSEKFWGKDYIMQATEAGFLNGIGDGLFAPDQNVTYYQLVKILVCISGAESEAISAGGWPNGYAETAYRKAILSRDMYQKIAHVNGNAPATRGDVSLLVYNTINPQSQGGLIVNGKTYTLGMSAHSLDKPEDTLTSMLPLTWYVYGTKDYQDFFIAGVADEKVVALLAEGIGFTYDGLAAGDILGSNSANSQVFLLDQHDNNRIHGVFLIEDAYYNRTSGHEAGLIGESKIVFHLANAFRVMHGIEPLIWSENASISASLHSQDQADQNYFSHTSLDGRNIADRLEAQGIRWTKCAENISAGHHIGVLMHDGWVNSEGHRKNILLDCKYLGVGGSFNEQSDYEFYFTQNFYR